MLKSMSAVAGVVLLGCGTALAHANPAQSGQMAAAAEPKLICKVVTSTGSRLAKKRACATKAEWDQIAKNAEKDTKNMQGDTPGLSGVN